MLDLEQQAVITARSTMADSSRSGSRAETGWGMAPSFQVGRVAWAGDAAHLVSPAGGMGLNAGIADADNLRLRPWVSSEKHNVVAIDVDEVSGREFHLARPWQHMLPD